MTENRIAVFASGTGSNFKNIINKTSEGFIPAKIELLVTDNTSAGAIKIAHNHNIPVKVFSNKEFLNREDLNVQMLNTLKDYTIKYIVLAGYLKLIGSNIVKEYNNRILNIHPALLPSFGGKGMFGHLVHQAVFEHGVKVSGATVHLVNEIYDAGSIVLQKTCSIEGLNSPEEIARQVLKLEHEIYPKAVKLLVENKLRINGRRVEIIGDTLIENE
jgi:formyltetrahydrofolate-dependent phosphoribosylglycinamide formyltransferase